MLLRTLATTLLGQLLTGKGTVKDSIPTGDWFIRAGKEAIRASEKFWCHLILN